MTKEKKWNALAILNVLMTADDYLTTNQIVDKVGCERKAVYNAMTILEVNGFGIDVIESSGRGREPNKYKFVTLHGLD